jgi:Holliday junction resolvase
LYEWERNSGMQTFIAWRMNGESWFFIKLSEMKKTEKNYTVTKKTAQAIARRLESIII